MHGHRVKSIEWTQQTKSHNFEESKKNERTRKTVIHEIHQDIGSSSPLLTHKKKNSPTGWKIGFCELYLLFSLERKRTKPHCKLNDSVYVVTLCASSELWPHLRSVCIAGRYVLSPLPWGVVACRLRKKEPIYVLFISQTGCCLEINSMWMSETRKLTEHSIGHRERSNIKLIYSLYRVPS